MIARVRVVVQQGRVRIASVAFVHDPQAGHRQGYISIATARDDAATARDVVAAELRRVQSSLRRCLSLAGVLGLQAQVETLLSETDGLVALLDLDDDELNAALAA